MVENMETLIKLLDVIIWPITILALALIFKSELAKLLTRISKFKYKGIEADFQQVLKTVEKTTEQTNKIVSETSINLRESYEHTLKRIIRVAEISPRACVSEAWREVEGVTITLMHAYGYDHRDVQMSKVFRGIVYENDYPWSLYEDYKLLLKLRNQAFHAGEFELDIVEAKHYARTAIDLAIFIEKLAKEAPNKVRQQDASSGASA